MPEGDTIWKAARALHAALAGRVVTGFRSALPAVASSARHRRVVGSTVAGVQARGKHLLMRFSTGPVLHTHLRMRGSWHLYRPGSPWFRPAGQARAVIETAEAIAVCFAAPVVELLSPTEEASHPVLRALGPDVLAPAFAAGPAVTRLRAQPQMEIGEAVLDQSLLAGIGNIYKSETLFVCGIDPFALVATLDDATLDRLVRTAERLMKGSLERARRRPTPAPPRHPSWVYQHAGRPCRRCATLILMRRQGRMERPTYWCPRCQPRLTMSELQPEGDIHALARRRHPPAHAGRRSRAADGAGRPRRG